MRDFGASQWTVAQLLIAILPTEGAHRMRIATPQIVVTASIIGACIGFSVPSPYRSKSPGNHARESLTAPLPAA